MAKNTHLEHLEDDILNNGVEGGENCISFLEELGKMLSEPSSSIRITTKWDGAPAIICGTDPSTGLFFVGNKSVFAKTQPKICTSDYGVDKYYPTSGLNSILKECLKYLSQLDIKGVLQGDLLFTSGTKQVKTINGQKCVTFTPNTITYAIPVDSDMGKKVMRSKIGIVFHTTYSGPSISEMSASFGVDVKPYQGHDDIAVFSSDFDDASGAANFSAQELQKFQLMINRAKGSIKKSSPFLDVLGQTGTGKYLLSVLFKQFFNSFIRQGKSITNVKQMIQSFNDYYANLLEKEISTKKTAVAKEKYRTIQQEGLKFLSENEESIYFTIASYMNIQSAKEVVIRKLEQVKTLGTFLRTENGYKVTAPEGFVAIKSGSALKLVDRLEFSRANFSADKTWDKGESTLKNVNSNIGNSGNGDTKSVAITFGRFNPPTVGHQKLLNAVKKIASGDDYIIYTSHSQDAKKNPLSSDVKVGYMREMFPEHRKNITYDTSLKTIIFVLKDLQNSYTDVTLVVGSDRVSEMKTLVERYNGKDYSFKTITVKSAGERDPDAEGVSGMSASKMRKAAADRDFKSFRMGIPKGLNDKKTTELMEEVRRGMKL